VLSLLVGVAMLGFVLVACGCGSEEIGAPTTVPSPSPTKTKVAASGPAIPDKIAFDQLALESSVKRVQSKNGPVFLVFRYADMDGKVYECKLPEAMSRGVNSLRDWVALFDIYKVPKVLKKKPVSKKKGPEEIIDYPYIAPKPHSSPSQPGTPAATPPSPTPSPNNPAVPTPSSR